MRLIQAAAVSARLDAVQMYLGDDQRVGQLPTPDRPAAGVLEGHVGGGPSVGWTVEAEHDRRVDGPDVAAHDHHRSVGVHRQLLST
ncbi:hypothetical protein [Micromonospora sp. CPCC 206061]|uniref:hypothetical protein n=1 Tax=Micromonospora sp. CPCC 206061 TaxID=3122410 RepID=UPI002FF3039D